MSLELNQRADRSDRKGKDPLTCRDVGADAGCTVTLAPHCSD